jgi:hypothetical protein
LLAEAERAAVRAGGIAQQALAVEIAFALVELAGRGVSSRALASAEAAGRLSLVAQPLHAQAKALARGGAGLFGARGGPAEAAAGGGRRVVSGARRRGRRGGASRPAQAFTAAQLASRIERGMAPLAALAEKFLLPAARGTAERTRRTRRAKRPWAQTSAQQQQPAARFSGVVPPGQGEGAGLLQEKGLQVEAQEVALSKCCTPTNRLAI